MADSGTLLLKKEVLFKAIPLLFTVLFFLMIAPIDQLAPFRNVDPVVIFSGALMFALGIVFLVEYFRNLPQAKNHVGAKSGAYLFLGMSILTFIYGIAEIFGLYNPFTGAGNTDPLNLGLTVLLFLSSVILYAGIHPQLAGYKSLSHALRNS